MKFQVRLFPSSSLSLIMKKDELAVPLETVLTSVAAQNSHVL
jgi:hypothetical protein